MPDPEEVKVEQSNVITEPLPLPPRSKDKTTPNSPTSTFENSTVKNAGAPAASKPRRMPPPPLPGAPSTPRGGKPAENQKGSSTSKEQTVAGKIKELQPKFKKLTERYNAIYANNPSFFGTEKEQNNKYNEAINKNSEDMQTDGVTPEKFLSSAIHYVTNIASLVGDGNTEEFLELCKNVSYKFKDATAKKAKAEKTEIACLDKIYSLAEKSVNVLEDEAKLGAQNVDIRDVQSKILGLCKKYTRFVSKNISYFKDAESYLVSLKDNDLWSKSGMKYFLEKAGKFIDKIISPLPKESREEFTKKFSDIKGTYGKINNLLGCSSAVYNLAKEAVEKVENEARRTTADPSERLVFLKKKFEGLQKDYNKFCAEYSIDKEYSDAVDKIYKMMKDSDVSRPGIFLNDARNYITNIVTPLGNETISEFDTKCIDIINAHYEAVEAKNKAVKAENKAAEAESNEAQANCLTQMYELAKKALSNLKKEFGEKSSDSKNQWKYYKGEFKKLNKKLELIINGNTKEFENKGKIDYELVEKATDEGTFKENVRKYVIYIVNAIGDVNNTYASIDPKKFLYTNSTVSEFSYEYVYEVAEKAVNLLGEKYKTPEVSIMDLKPKFDRLYDSYKKIYGKYKGKIDIKSFSAADRSYYAFKNTKVPDDFCHYVGEYIRSIVNPLGEEVAEEYKNKIEKVKKRYKKTSNEKTKAICLEELYTLAKKAGREWEEKTEGKDNSPSVRLEFIKSKFKTLNDDYSKICEKYSIDKNCSDNVDKIYKTMKAGLKVGGFFRDAINYITNIVTPLGDETISKFDTKCTDISKVYDNAVEAKNEAVQAECLTEMYELALRAVYHLKNKMEMAQQEEQDKEKGKSKKSTKSKKHGKNNNAKADKIKKCFTNVGTYFLNSKKFTRKDMKSKLSDVKKICPDWYKKLSDNLKWLNEIEVAEMTDAKEKKPIQSMVILLIGICGLPDTEYVISACNGLKAGGLKIKDEKSEQKKISDIRHNIKHYAVVSKGNLRKFRDDVKAKSVFGAYISNCNSSNAWKNMVEAEKKAESLKIGDYTADVTF